MVSGGGARWGGAAPRTLPGSARYNFVPGASQPRPVTFALEPRSHASRPRQEPQCETICSVESSVHVTRAAEKRSAGRLTASPHRQAQAPATPLRAAAWYWTLSRSRR